MTANPARRNRRAASRIKRPTRMTEYQRNRQAEGPTGAQRLYAHLHNLDLNEFIDAPPGVFEAIPCEVCEAAVEWSEERERWQHHATKMFKCAGDRGVATPPAEYLEEHDEGDALVDDKTDDDVRPLTRREAREAGEAARGIEPKPPRVDGNPYDTEFARHIMLALQDRPVYQGTVQPDEVERRRLRNRDANRSRRANRRARVKRSSARHHGGAAAVAWLMLFSVMYGGAFYYASDADAVTNSVALRIEATWLGGNPCDNTAVAPATYNPAVLAPAVPTWCSNETTDYRNVHPGEYFGIDPNIGDAFAVSCKVTIAGTGSVVLIDYARNGDGHNATCLGRWS